MLLSSIVSVTQPTSAGELKVLERPRRNNRTSAYLIHGTAQALNKVFVRLPEMVGVSPGSNHEQEAWDALKKEQYRNALRAQLLACLSRFPHTGQRAQGMGMRDCGSRVREGTPCCEDKGPPGSEPQGNGKKSFPCGCWEDKHAGITVLIQE